MGSRGRQEAGAPILRSHYWHYPVCRVVITGPKALLLVSSAGRVK